MQFAISPDENPGDPGAVHNGIVERDVNIAVASHLEAALKRSGQDVWFDSSITFTQRINEANANGTQVLVACAHNAAGSPAAEGAQFLFCGAAAHAFGHQQAAADKCGATLVAGGLVQHYSTYDENVAECCDFNGDTVYVEFGFETNPTDAATIKQPDYPSRAAELLCQGLAATFGFPYAPPVHPSAPPPEWKANLVALPAPLTGVLAASVTVIDTITNIKVTELAAGTTLTVAFETKVRGTDYYVTQFSVDHATGSAIAKASVTFVAPQPAAGSGSITPPVNPSPVTTPPPPPSGAPTPPAVVPPPPASTAPPPSQTPPPPPPTPAAGSNFFRDVEESLVNFADHEIIQLIEGAIAELKKRGS